MNSQPTFPFLTYLNLMNYGLYMFFFGDYGNSDYGKQRLQKLWKMGVSKEDYLATKKCAKRAVYDAKKVA